MMFLIIVGIDFITIFLLGTTIIGSLALYMCVKNYVLIRTKDYLLLTIFFFGQTFYAFWRLLTRIHILVGPTDNYPTIDPLWWEQGWLQILVNTAWGIMLVALMIHIIRLFDWKKLHAVTKGILLVILLEIIGLGFYFCIYPIWYFEQKVYYLGYWTTPEWYTKLWLTHWIISPPIAAMNALGAFILYPLLAVAYYQIKPVVENRRIRTVQFLWIFFAIVNALTSLYFLSMTWDMFSVQYDPVIYQTALDGFELLSFISIASILLVVSFYPESLLITETQLIQARNLEETFKTGHLSSTESRSTSKYFSFLDSKKKLVEYISSLPQELQEQLNINT